ncbi:MAG TPA: hypothetical protein VEG60_01080, partial [Candidatus Binatia bacterium]|nr:hypothetical protein [Candidatus Binatia bacterium]
LFGRVRSFSHPVYPSDCITVEVFEITVEALLRSGQSAIRFQPHLLLQLITRLHHRQRCCSEPVPLMS